MNFLTRNPNNRRGESIADLVVVLIIIGVVAALGVVFVTGIFARGSAQRIEAKSQENLVALGQGAEDTRIVDGGDIPQWLGDVGGTWAVYTDAVDGETCAVPVYVTEEAHEQTIYAPVEDQRRCDEQDAG